MAGGDYCEPIPYRACITSDEEADRRATERAAAGMCELDAESAAFAPGVVLPNPGGGDPWDDDEVEEEPLPGLLRLIRTIYADFGNPSGMTEDELFDELHRFDPASWDLDRFVPDGKPMTKGAVLALMLDKVLAPRGQKWTKESYRPKGASKTVKGYRLRDLKALIGEGDEA